MGMNETNSCVYRISSPPAEEGEVFGGRLFDGDSHKSPYQLSPVSYATALADGECELEINVDEDIKSFSAWPARHILDSRVEARKISLKTAKSCHVVIQVNQLEPLLLSVSPPPKPPDPARGAVLQANESGIIPGTSRILTSEINAAIDGLAERGGGTIVFAPGIYQTGTINMRSGVFIHLMAGAALLGSDNSADYPEEPEEFMETNLPPSLIPGSRRGLIYFNQVVNSGVEGAGMVCGNGCLIRSAPSKRPLINLVRAIKSENLRFDGVYLADSEFWSVHLILCRDISFRGTKIVSEIPPRGWDSWKHPGSQSCWNNADGINPDSSRDVRVEDCLFHTGDDCLPVKNTGTHKNILRDCEDIEIKKCLMITSTTALKIGTESRGANMRHILFEDIDIFQASRVLGLDMKDGAKASDIVFRGIRVKRCNRPLDIWVIPREKQVGQKNFSVIRDVRVEDLTIDEYMCEQSNYESHVHGRSDEHDVRDVSFKGLRIAGQLVDAPSQAHIQINEFAKDVVFSE